MMIIGIQLRLTAREQYHNSKADRRQHVLNHEKAKEENANVIEAERLLASQDKRTLSVSGYQSYIKLKHNEDKPLIAFYGNMLWRKFNFRVDSYKHKSLDLFIMKIGKLIISSNHHHLHHNHNN